MLGFSSADPAPRRVLFTEARANPVLAARREIAQELLRQMVLSERAQAHPGEKPVATAVAAAMYTGAMAELAQQWLAGNRRRPRRCRRPRRSLGAAQRLKSGRWVRLASVVTRRSTHSSPANPRFRRPSLCAPVRNAHYAEAADRRFRVLRITTVIAALVSAGFGFYQLTLGRAMWPIGIVNLGTAVAFLAIPQLRCTANSCCCWSSPHWRTPRCSSSPGMSALAPGCCSTTR